MSDMEEFRFRSHDLLVKLDAATSRIMMLVLAGQMHGPIWDDAVVQHKVAVEAWQAFLASPNSVKLE